MSLRAIAILSLPLALSLSLVTSATAQAGQTKGVVVRKINRIKTVSRVPSDTRSLTVRSVKFVQVPTEQVLDYSFCSGVNTYEPGGSNYCPRVTERAKVTAIEVDFTYEAPSTADEHGIIFNTDYLYLDPATLTSAQLAKIPAKGKLKGKAAAEVIGLGLTTAKAPTLVIDDSKSFYCPTHISGDYFVKDDPNCEDRIATRPSFRSYTVVRAILK